MAFSIDSIFTTRTALPKNGGIVEIEPIVALKPYVRCFWTCERDKANKVSRVIPDCCADIIIDVENDGAGFVGMCLDSFAATHINAIFGIRFYAWAVPQFTRTNAVILFNALINPQNLFNNFTEFKDSIIEAKSTSERVELAQKYLIGLLDSRCDSDVMNSLCDIVINNGNISVSDLSRGIAVSKRTLERKFMQSIGVSPKTITEAVRYQLLWQDCIDNRFCAIDSVEKFGYYDQAHMYNDFKRYHGIGLGEARQEYYDLSRFYNTVD
ncbi:MAG: AraC family transcriptional regulator [Clostridiales bacterium]|nr:AraC family transcriptional regulator [Clostridiales bacterium]